MFKTFSEAVHARYNTMALGELFVVDVTDIFESYLNAFPEGTNPMFRVRTKHDCNCCKQFIRRLGVLIAFDDSGNRMTVWDDFPTLPEPYGTVAKHLADLVRQAPISGVFRTKERQYGTAFNFDNHTNQRWDHFHGKVASRHLSNMPQKVAGELNTTGRVFKRGLEEITEADIETVLDLIDSKSIYRGEEHKPSILAFRQLQREYRKAADRDGFVWANIGKPGARFRNTVIGTLLVDLANGVELEEAVKAFERKVAPENYKRPTALITPKMIEQAVAKLNELGLQDHVHRRFAVIEDVSVNDVLFVDNAVRSQMKDGLTELLMAGAKPPRAGKGNAAMPISIENFMQLGASKIELVLSNDQLSNFVSLTAGEPGLFKWDNGFAWMYDGEVADSLKERVKMAGGKTGANVKLRVSLGWHNSDDLDIHVRTPNREHIYFGNRAGVLDVDMNAGGVQNSTNPVENLSWTSLRDGVYAVWVDMFSKRNTNRKGFMLEVDAGGVLHQFAHEGDPKRGQIHLNITVRNGVVVDVVPGQGVIGGSRPTDKWGISTNTPVRVDSIMLSPNHWEGAGAVGNKHWFFILDGCKNPDSTRGFVNEFLRGSLDPHRKVFEVLSSKTKCPPSDRQLSGVGFSSTRNDKITAIADGRTYEVSF